MASRSWRMYRDLSGTAPQQLLEVAKARLLGTWGARRERRADEDDTETDSVGGETASESDDSSAVCTLELAILHSVETGCLVKSSQAPPLPPSTTVDLESAVIGGRATPRRRDERAQDSDGHRSLSGPWPGQAMLLGMVMSDDTSKRVHVFTSHRCSRPRSVGFGVVGRGTMDPSLLVPSLHTVQYTPHRGAHSHSAQESSERARSMS